MEIHRIKKDDGSNFEFTIKNKRKLNECSKCGTHVETTDGNKYVVYLSKFYHDYCWFDITFMLKRAGEELRKSKDEVSLSEMIDEAIRQANSNEYDYIGGE